MILGDSQVSHTWGGRWDGSQLAHLQPPVTSPAAHTVAFGESEKNVAVGLDHQAVPGEGGGGRARGSLSLCAS